ncbi:hypothetical protein INR77_07180 [Erythrobacter sp. SCSIO 43205]|uniref:hypothetical protein n=1 Tax=Erythrobacter sp. SCSIO 43205 TaxID=2779361 RepID=UPI001CA986CE|nr:hypothetical protein [Erythrobacter sp. SCSIO 43205]UAB79438.1 hypothetical protein INR77_07180 [Erythrobacter sp. SCSIO 43205]
MGLRLLAILVAIALIGVGVWAFTRDGGVLQNVTEERVEGALLANGMPLPMAECMAPRLTERLSVEQLQKLEKLGPQGGETVIPGSRSEAIERLRRVEDSEAVSALIGTATSCGIELIGENF